MTDMPRQARVIVSNTPHHVYHRTFPRRSAFYTEKDYQQYLDLLKENAKLYKLDILAWCLLKNAVHLVVIPRRANSLAQAIGRTHFSYTHYINQKRKNSGQLWRNRFQSCALDDSYLKAAVHYVECQPVQEKLVRKAEKYPWSSAGAHVRKKDDLELLSLKVWPKRALLNGWSKLLSGKPDAQTQEMIRTHTQTGRPLGDDSFIRKLERKFGRRLHALPIGRPPKD